MFLFKSKKKYSKPKTLTDAFSNRAEIYSETIEDTEKLLKEREMDLEWIRNFKKEEEDLLTERKGLLEELENKLKYCERSVFVSKWVYDLADKDSDGFEIKFGKRSPAYYSEYVDFTTDLENTQRAIKDLLERIAESEKGIRLYERWIEEDAISIERLKTSLIYDKEQLSDAKRSIEEEKEYRKELEEAERSVKRG